MRNPLVWFLRTSTSVESQIGEVIIPRARDVGDAYYWRSEAIRLSDLLARTGYLTEWHRQDHCVERAKANTLWQSLKDAVDALEMAARALQADGSPGTAEAIYGAWQRAHDALNPNNDEGE